MQGHVKNAEDRVQPGTWKLLGCDNGLRFFQEVPSSTKASYPLFVKQLKVVKCVGVVDTSAERACSLILDYGPLRSLWDSTVENAHVFESQDGKTDVLQLIMRPPRHYWGCGKPHHMVLLRWWTKHTDGSYVIFFKTMSPTNPKQEQCSLTPPSSWLDCGAYIIRPLPNSPPPPVTSPVASSPVSPVTQQSPLTHNDDNNNNDNNNTASDLSTKSSPSVSSRCQVELALETEETVCQTCSFIQSLCCSSPQASLLDPVPTNIHSPESDCIFCACCSPSSNSFLRNAMFHSIAGLREFCSATGGAPTVSIPPHTLSHRSHEAQSPQPMRMRRGKASPNLGSAPDDVAALRQPLLLRKAESEGNDETFEECTVESLSDLASEVSEGGLGPLALAAVQQLPPLGRVLSVQEQAYPLHVDWETFHGSVRRGDPREGDCRNSWMPPHGTQFLVRGETFYTDGAKAVAEPPLCQPVAVDWFYSKVPMREVAKRKGCLVQKVRECYGDRAPFFIVLNLQIPAGSKGHYSLLFYFATSDGAPCLQPGTLLHRFITSDDNSFRQERLTLIPAIPVGSWLIRKAVGSERFVMLADVLSTKFARGEGFIEIDVNMGTSSVVSGIMGLVIPCMSVLTVDMAFLVRAEETDQLPEELFGAVRCCNLEQGSAVSPPE